MARAQEPLETPSERESRKVAEAARQTEWNEPSFIRELFLGRFRLDLIHPFPTTATPRPEFQEFYDRFRSFLRDHVDPVEIKARLNTPLVFDGRNIWNPRNMREHGFSYHGIGTL